MAFDTGVSFDISGDDVIEVRQSPALEAAANLEALKASGAKLVAAKEWDAALKQYGKVLDACAACKDTLASDFEAERAAEKCFLACLSNQALCALKLERFEEAKKVCGDAVKKHEAARVVDNSALAKCLFRKGQACVGLQDARSAVECITAAVRIEEGVIAVAPAESVGQKQRGLVAMKRELLRARKQAREESKAASSSLKIGGFLAKGSKMSLEDPRDARAKLCDAKIDCALAHIFADPKEKGTAVAPNYDVMIHDLVRARHDACSAKDLKSELRLTFAEGFVAFLASAPEAENAVKGIEKYYLRCADAMESYWALRGELAKDTADASDLDPPCDLGDVAALECTAHCLMQLKRHGDARPYFEKYVAIAAEAGPLLAYHNLPDSFLLSRGMPKMNDKGRRVSRWKHRAHAPRALFDARTALAAICTEFRDRPNAKKHTEAAFEHAADDDERLTAHRNMAFILRKPTTVYQKDSDSKFDEVPPTAEDLKEAEEHDERCKALEVKIAETKAKEEKKAAQSKIDGGAVNHLVDPPSEFESAPEFNAECEGTVHGAEEEEEVDADGMPVEKPLAQVDMEGKPVVDGFPAAAVPLA